VGEPETAVAHIGAKKWVGRGLPRPNEAPPQKGAPQAIECWTTALHFLTCGAPLWCAATFRVQTPGYVPKKNLVGFLGYTHLKKPTPKNPHFYFNLILV